MVTCLPHHINIPGPDQGPMGRSLHTFTLPAQGAKLSLPTVVFVVGKGAGKLTSSRHLSMVLCIHTASQKCVFPRSHTLSAPSPGFWGLFQRGWMERHFCFWFLFLFLFQRRQFKKNSWLKVSPKIKTETMSGLKLVAQLCRLFTTSWAVSCQAPLSMDVPGKNIGEACHFLLQGIFLTQGSNPGLLHCRQILYHLSHFRFHWVT